MTIFQRLVVGILFALSPLPAGSQQETAENASETPSPYRFFLEAVDFWGTRQKANTATGKPSETEKTIHETIWAEPVRMPDGRYSIYVPPKPVLDFLENPTEESLEGYLAWQQDRARKLTRALKLLEAYKVRMRISEEEKSLKMADRLTKPVENPPDAPSPPTPPPAPEKGVSKAPFEILYFHQKRCPHCDRQDAILAQWLPGHPEATLKVLESGESPDLWRENNVRGTPTLKITDPQNKKSTLMEGTADADRLDRALAETREAPQEAGKEKP